MQPYRLGVVLFYSLWYNQEMQTSEIKSYVEHVSFVAYIDPDETDN